MIQYCCNILILLDVSLSVDLMLNQYIMLTAHPSNVCEAVLDGDNLIC